MGGTSYKKGEIAFSVVLLLTGLVFLLESMSISTAGQPFVTSPRAMPVLLSTLVTGTSLTILARAVLASRRLAVMSPGVSPKALTYIFITSCYIVGLFLLPFSVASIAFMAWSFVYWKAVEPARAVLYAIVLAAGTMWLFARFFYVVF